MWRTGRKVGRTIYRDDTLVGVVDTPELARELVDAANERVALRFKLEEARAALTTIRNLADKGDYLSTFRIGTVSRAALDAACK